MSYTPHSLRIGIVTRDLSKQGGGTRVHMENILARLDQRTEIARRIFLLHNSREYRGKFQNIREMYTPVQQKWIFEYVVVPYWAIRNRLNVIVLTRSISLFLPWVKNIFIAYDLGHFVKGLNAYTWFDRMITKPLMRRAVKKASVILAISQSTKDDLVRFLGVPPEKVLVNYLAASPEFRRVQASTDLEGVKARYQLPEKFLLFTGGISPRKNLLRVLEAFSKLPDKFSDYHFVLTGIGGWSNASELRAIRETPRVHKLGYVDEGDMPALYSLAAVYIYPSLYEGFGLPILEAQACGSPVLTSNVSSCPEVAGGGALIVDPYSVERIRDGIEKILTDAPFRSNLIKKGFKNAQRFSWDRSLDEFLSVLNEQTL